eukprot:COSAG05_NODE_358_length_10812_cov_90.986372_3_plen_61_part_00
MRVCDVDIAWTRIVAMWMCSYDAGTRKWSLRPLGRNAVLVNGTRYAGTGGASGDSGEVTM